MERKWVAKPYVYADGFLWNSDRYEIFVINDKRELVSVGGAICTWGGNTIAFLCKKSVNREIRTPLQAEEKASGHYVWGESVKSALQTLKWKYSDPESLLREIHAREMAAF
jgi:hypothetical protein